MYNALFNVPKPTNETVYSYRPGSKEKNALKSELGRQLSEQIDIPLFIGGEEVRTGNTSNCVVPHNHTHVLAKFHKAGKGEVATAISAAIDAKDDWANMPWNQRAAIFLKAADLLAHKYRPILNAATMLGQSKAAFQAEIDSACELIDFFRFNVYFMQELYKWQPESAPGIWNLLEHRPLDGFVFAITPFNFTSIAGNLPTAPALMGNTVVWKPASTAVYSAHFIMELLREAGLPSGVINMVIGSGSDIGEAVLSHPDLAGVHFTGSTAVFQNIWKTIGSGIDRYKSYPRIVGETGGKDFIFAHSSADIGALATAIVRGAFEFQGQKCSAASRAYMPASIWPKVKQRVIDDIATIKMGDVTDFTNFMGAVIDKNAFDNISGYIDYAKKSSDAKIIAGGECASQKGYFIRPTVIETTNPNFKTMQEEIFGPVITIYAYDDDDFEETLNICDKTSPYALTGSIFSQDRKAIVTAANALRFSAGNFYVNDKPTGAVVGQQPFGGARASGTNDKAGSMFNLLRWVSQRTIKETFCPPRDYRYPFMEEK